MCMRISVEQWNYLSHPRESRFGQRPQRNLMKWDGLKDEGDESLDCVFK